jgi:DNA end-binding protein Ku
MAPRAIWRGSITFGLISIPVKIFSAVGRESGEKIDLHMLHEKDGERIHYQRTCDKGHKDIDWDEIVKGYEYQKGKWVEITDDDLAAIDLETLRTIDVQTFSPFEQIDPMYFDKTYYVVPDEAGIKAYRLVAEALDAEGLVGISKVAIRERERLSALRIKDGMLVLETMHWPEELRDANFAELKKRPKVQDRERKMARQLIKQLSDDFDPGQFKDEYHKALKKIINKKVKGEEIVIPERAEEPDTVVDLMEALKASVAAAKRGERPKPQRAASKKKASKSGGNGKASDEDLGALSKKDLDERAKELGIPGRSKMDKKALVRALKKSA